MIYPTIPGNEAQRLSNLKDYMILDTVDESDFDEITMLASQICGTPISLVSLVDDRRQWFKSHHGLEVKETPKEISFCSHAINSPGSPFIVPDSRIDNRFSDNPLVTGTPHVIFYAGVPLVTPKGYALGTLCVIDHHPKQLTEQQLKSLEALSHQVMCQMELRRKNRELLVTHEELTNNYNDMEQFASVAAHDLKSPLHNITTLIDYFLDENTEHINEEGLMYLEHVKTSSEQLSRLIDAILQYSKSTQVITNDREFFTLNDVIESVIGLLQPGENISIKYPAEITALNTSRIAVKQILLNLINNAIKYNSSPQPEITITFDESEHFYHLSVSDNGPGIPDKHLETIFDLFATVKGNDKSGTGIGLAIVKRLVKKLKGDIQVHSTKDGTTFSFTLGKMLV
jgi:signal transduction histidine kinase